MLVGPLQRELGGGVEGHDALAILGGVLVTDVVATAVVVLGIEQTVGVVAVVVVLVQTVVGPALNKGKIMGSRGQA